MSSKRVPVISSHILLIDDSNQICSIMISGIVKACAESGRGCQIVQAGPMGLIETVPMNFAFGAAQTNSLTVYTANSSLAALAVLRLPSLKRLTIICDVMMPTDNQVGLVGLLKELSLLKLPVNLVFASSEGQNRYYVEELLKNHKAYFLEKGTDAWASMPFALVQKSDMFEYHIISQSDYDKGYLYRNQKSNQAAPAYRPTPLPVSIPARTVDKPISKPKAGGLLPLLMFWRKRTS